MPVVSRQLFQLRHDLSRAMGDLVAVNGSLANPTTTTFHDPVLTFQRADALKGSHVHFYTGGGAAKHERPIYASVMYSPGSPSLYGRLDVLQPWGAAPSTNSGWEVHKLFTVAEYNAAIFRAMRKYALKMMVPKVDYSNISYALLRNGTFHLWPDGASAAPGSWSGDANSTHSRGANAYQGLYAYSMVTDGSNVGQATQSIDQFELYAGKTVSIRAKVYTLTSGRVRITLSDGVNTYNSDFHNGASDNEREQFLEINNVVVSNALTQLQVQLNVTAGGAVTAVWQKVYDDLGMEQHEYDIPNTEATRFARIQKVETEGIQDGVFNVLIPRRYWDLNLEVSPRRLVLDKGVLPIAGKVLKITGQGYATEPSGETVTVDVDPEMVLEQAGVFLLQSLPRGQADAQGLGQRLQEWVRNVAVYEDRPGTRPMINSTPVEAL
jgi:hypothetical protein